jgi:uncharacterized protein with PQ loop repeat
MPNGIHHIHRRKRVHHNLEPYPHKDKYVRLLDQLLLVIAIVAPIMSIPQVLKIYLHHNSSGISTFSFVMFTLFNIPWIFYGIVHKEKPIVITYILWFISNIFIVVGSLMYQ